MFICWVEESTEIIFKRVWILFLPTVEHTNLLNLTTLQSKDHDDSDSRNIDCIDSDVIEQQHPLGSSDWSDLWDTPPSTFPSDLARLCSNIAQLVHEDLEAEAAIVNYYPLGTCMGGHLDDAEHIMTKPLDALPYSS